MRADRVLGQAEPPGDLSDPITAGLAFLPMIGGLLVSANVSSNVLLPRIGPAS